MKLTFAFLVCSIAAVLSLSALAGCGKPGFASAEGIVTLDGNPLADATVVFSAPGLPLATARTDSDGEFQMTTGSINGIKPGEYAVSVTAFEKSPTTGKPIPKLATPQKYAKAESSNLKVVINDEGNDDITLDLHSL